MAKKKAKKAKKGSKDVLVVASKVKGYIKSKKFMSSSDVIEALNLKIYALVDDAMGRTAANKRSTVRGKDL